MQPVFTRPAHIGFRIQIRNKFICHQAASAAIIPKIDRNIFNPLFPDLVKHLCQSFTIKCVVPAGVECQYRKIIFLIDLVMNKFLVLFIFCAQIYSRLLFRKIVPLVFSQEILRRHDHIFRRPVFRHIIICDLPAKIHSEIAQSLKRTDTGLQQQHAVAFSFVTYQSRMRHKKILKPFAVDPDTNIPVFLHQIAVFHRMRLRIILIRVCMPVAEKSKYRFDLPAQLISRDTLPLRNLLSYLFRFCFRLSRHSVHR